MATFTTVQGLPHNQVNTILEDEFGRLWVTYEHGIYSILKQQLNDVAARRASSIRAISFDESDGLLTTEFNGQKSYPPACKTRDGRLWFSTPKGLAVFDPSKMLKDEIAPLIVIEQIRTNGQLLFDNGPPPGVANHDRDLNRTQVGASNQKPEQTPNAGDKPTTLAVASHLHNWRLPPGSARVLQFVYSANSLIAPEKIRFKYRLLGLDAHWIDAGTRREAFFTALRPGDYQFEVIACNHHGVWPERGTVLGFHLMPFFYQTWWFYSGAGSLLLALVALAFIWRLREVRRIHQLEQIKALNEQRKQIARDIHDDIGASLTHILQLSGETGKDPARRDQTATQTARIASVAEEAVDHISEILWANNPAYDTLEDLVSYLREYAAIFFEATSISVRFDFPEIIQSKKVSGIFRRHVLLLVKEALQNVVKHASAKQARLSLDLSDNRFKLSIADDGCGCRPNGAGKQGNGLANMRERVSELSGTFDLVSQPGCGTELRVSLPLVGSD